MTKHLSQVATQQFTPVQGGLVAHSFMTDNQLEDVRQENIRMRQEMEQLKRDTSDVLQYVRSAMTEQPRVGGGHSVAPPVMAALINCMERMEEHVFPVDDPSPMEVEELPISMDAQQQQQLLLLQQREWEEGPQQQQQPEEEEQPPQ